jgi:hypothetical protein
VPKIVGATFRAAFLIPKLMCVLAELIVRIFRHFFTPWLDEKSPLAEKRSAVSVKIEKGSRGR